MCFTSAQDQYDLYGETLEIRRSVLCIICLEVYCKPVSLPCSHSFCKDCILEASKVKLKCPICSAEFTKRSITPLNHLNPLVSDVAALVKSLTGGQRYSLSLDDMDKQYKEYQRALTSGHLRNHIRLLPPSVTERVNLSAQDDVMHSVIHHDYIPDERNTSFPVGIENLPSPFVPLPGEDHYGESVTSLHMPQLPRNEQTVHSVLVGHESRNEDIVESKAETLLNEMPSTSTASTMPAACEVPINITATTEGDIGEVSHPVKTAVKKDVAPDDVLALDESIHLLSNLTKESITFRPGEVVEVSPRMWSGDASAFSAY